MSPPLPPRIDFLHGALAHRLRAGGSRGEHLARAAGFSHGRTPSVIDATAGLGRDALLLASLGAQVTLIERAPAIHALLAAAIAAAQAPAAPPALAQAAARMTLLLGDSRTLLAALTADTILVDPMHPTRPGTALVKQDLRRLRDLVGDDTDAPALIHAALAAARRRVVLKWPRLAPLPPGLPAPSHQIIGKTLRYDVFVVG